MVHQARFRLAIALLESGQLFQVMAHLLVILAAPIAARLSTTKMRFGATIDRALVASLQDGKRWIEHFGIC